MPKRLKFLIFLAVILTTGHLLSSSIFSSNGPTPAKYDQKTYKTIKPQLQTIKEQITLTGNIQAESSTVVRFQASGKLSWIGVKVGDRVKKNQLLARLDQTELKKKFQKEMNDYITYRSEFEDTQDEYKTTKEKHLMTDEIKRILEREQMDLNNSVLDVEIADLAVKYSNLYSPIDGIITKVDQPIANVYITPATSEIEIIDPNSIYFETNIDEDEVGQLHLGQSGQVVLDNQPDNYIDSDIYFISFTPISGKSTTAYIVKFRLPIDNSNLKYRLGMNGDAILTLKQSDNALILPYDAIIEENDKKFVYKKTGDQLIAQEITTGIESDDYVEILTGLNLQDEIAFKK